LVVWRPKLSTSRATPLYRRIVDAMLADMESGRLAAGARLPPQRDLAHALGVSVGAVTRAYDTAVRRGLVAAHVGRGTYVIDRMCSASAQDGPIDLTINTAPVASADAIAEAIAALSRRASWAERLDYQPPFGLEVDRRAGAAWLARAAGYEGVDWRALICCSGAQNGMAIALMAFCTPGDGVLCEAVSFPGVKTLAQQMGCRLHGVKMDEQGIHPQALDRAAAETGARVLYVLPTLQNPTTRTMSAKRRADIIKVARARDLWIIEDDVYAPYARQLGLPPLAAMAPERTVFVTSLSKILSPGLRVGYLVAPAGEAFERCGRAMRALMHSPAGVGLAIATNWIESGKADDLARDVLAETRARTALAQAALKGLVDEPQTGASLHLWLPMHEIAAERAVARASVVGLRLAPPGAFVVSNTPTLSGLRLSIGSAANRATLERVLSILKDALKGKADNRHDAVL
jgi:DNA-binding transcriptional MocR family regulator